jgi:glycerate kinase
MAGQVLLRPERYRALGVVDAFACMDKQMSLADAMASSEKLLTKAARDFALKYLRLSGRD